MILKENNFFRKMFKVTDYAALTLCIPQTPKLVLWQTGSALFAYFNLTEKDKSHN